MSYSVPSALYPYELQAPAFAGMKADTMVGNTSTYPAKNDIEFGTVFGLDANGYAVLPVGSKAGGIALHSHTAASVDGKWVVGTAVPGFDKGRVWAKAGGACTPGAVAKYDPATGVFSDAGTATLANAEFRSALVSVPGVRAGIDPTESIVLVELHSPRV